MRPHEIAWVVGVICSSIATFISVWTIYMHLSNYVEPPVQRHLVRIILMIPVWRIF